MLTLAKIFCDCGSYFKFTYWSSASLHICKCKWMCTSEEAGNLESSWREGAFEGLRSLGCLSPASDSWGLPFPPKSCWSRSQCSPTRYLRSSKPYTLLFIYSLLRFPKRVWRKKSELPITWISAKWLWVDQREQNVKWKKRPTDWEERFFDQCLEGWVMHDHSEEIQWQWMQAFLFHW